jgi:hypothetical protein
VTLVLLGAAGVVLPIVLAASPPGDSKNWETVAAEIRRLQPEFVIAGDYHDAAQLAYRLRPLKAWDLSPAGLGVKSFPAWWRPEPFTGRDAAVIFEEPVEPAQLEAVRRCFEKMEGPVEVKSATGGKHGETYQIWAARGYRAPLPAMAARN